MQHESEDQALLHVARQLEALRKGPWMVCIFQPQEDGSVICHRTSHQFPDGLNRQCQESLAGTLDRAPIPEPLPAANLGIVNPDYNEPGPDSIG